MGPGAELVGLDRRELLPEVGREGPVLAVALDQDDVRGIGGGLLPGDLAPGVALGGRLAADDLRAGVLQQRRLLEADGGVEHLLGGAGEHDREVLALQGVAQLLLRGLEVLIGLEDRLGVHVAAEEVRDVAGRVDPLGDAVRGGQRDERRHARQLRVHGLVEPGPASRCPAR